MMPLTISCRSPLILPHPPSRSGMRTWWGMRGEELKEGEGSGGGTQTLPTSHTPSSLKFLVFLEFVFPDVYVMCMCCSMLSHVMIALWAQVLPGVAQRKGVGIVVG